jgi:Domain of unknown function (DUF4258)
MSDKDFWNDTRLKKEIIKHIENETFLLTKHAAEEQKNDGIDLQDTLNALRNGVHEKAKTGFNNKFQLWRYAIRGKTENLETVRVIVSFPHDMMIITVMKLKKTK